MLITLGLKEKLVAYIKHMEIELECEVLFGVQVKRSHEGKRQLAN